MLYTKHESFPCHRVLNIMEALKEAPANYLVYAKHVDAIYPVTAVAPDAGEETVSFASEETYGREPSKTYTTRQLLEEIEQSMKQEQMGLDTEAYLEAADNTDPDLDMQLCEPCEIAGYGIDDTCRLFFLIAGACWDYC